MPHAADCVRHTRDYSFSSGFTRVAPFLPVLIRVHKGFAVLTRSHLGAQGVSALTRFQVQNIQYNTDTYMQTYIPHNTIHTCKHTHKPIQIHTIQYNTIHTYTYNTIHIIQYTIHLHTIYNIHIHTIE